MHINDVEVRYERTFNLQNFESTRIGCTLSATLEDGDTLDDCIRVLYDAAIAHVKAEARPLLEMRGLINPKTTTQDKK